MNIPVEGSYPLPSFRSTVPNTTRTFDARLLTSFFSRTSNATTFLSKKEKKLIIIFPKSTLINLIVT